MKKITFVLFLALSGLCAGHARTVSAPDSDEAVWKEFVSVFVDGEVMQNMQNMFMEAFKRSSPTMSDAQAREMSAVMHKEITVFVVKHVLPYYKKNFTVEEIKQVNAFNRSPVGKKFQKAGPEMAKEVMRAVPELQQSLLPKIKEINDRYKSKTKAQ